MAAQKRNALGKGLSALLSDDEPQSHGSTTNVAPSAHEVGSINKISIAYITANPFQPRTDFDKEKLEELAESIRVQGIIQPITVRKLGKDSYQLISGERRFKASKLAGLTEIPAYLRTADDQQMLEMALIENIQRENLNSIEVAISYQRLLEECDLKQEQLGERVGKSRSSVTNYLRLLKLPPSIQAGLKDAKISMGHARAIISVDDVDVQLFIYNEIVRKELSVRQVEQLVRSLTDKDSSKTSEKPPLSHELRKVQDELSSKFGTKVVVKDNGKGQGQIGIPYLSQEDLTRILELLDW
ncbi:MAG: ParB family chromosome partitioning protein [Sphingobacteriales bacterium]|jgi:ParB family chromosome partitioning protein